MSMMLAPSPVSNGTGLFIGACAVVIIWFYAFSRGGYVSKDSFQIISVITIVLTVAMWILWLCAWMHQWHPLIYPEWRFEAVAKAGDDGAGGRRF